MITTRDGDQEMWGLAPGNGSELVDREKAARLMEAESLDLLLAHTQLNGGYLADFWFHVPAGVTFPYRTEHNLPLLQFVGLSGDERVEPFITGHTGANAMDLGMVDPWIKDRYLFGPADPREIRVEPAQTTRPVSLSAEEAVALALRDRGLQNARVGVEMTELGAGILTTLNRLLPEATFLDGSGVLDELRLVKGPEEILRLERACDAGRRAHLAISEMLRAGTTAREIAETVHTAAASLGMRATFCQVHPNRAAALHFLPDGERIVPGEPISVDLGVTFMSYSSDMAHNHSLGAPGQRVLSVHAGLQSVVRELAGACKPGIECAQLHSVGKKALAQVPGIEVPYEMLGHGFGRNLHEKPVISPRDRTIIQSGMTLAIELPMYLPGEGWIQLEENYVVTDSECKWLTPWTLDILVAEM